MTTVPPLDDSVRRHLLALARHAISDRLGTKRGQTPFSQKRGLTPYWYVGVFVTIRMRGELRGCIGRLDANAPLETAVEECAVAAALRDPRFPPLTSDEWAQSTLEISVLGPIEPVADLSDVVVSRHGLLIESGRRRGLLLPQVAAEHRWSAEEFAGQTCAKAGLPHDAWRTGTTLFRFEADVFAE